MSSEYTESFERSTFTSVTVTVTGADDEAQARELAGSFATETEPGRWVVGLSNAIVEVELRTEDDDTESNEDGEWYPDEDEEYQDAGLTKEAGR